MITNVRIEITGKDPITLTLDELRQIWTDIDPLFRAGAACTCTARTMTWQNYTTVPATSSTVTVNPNPA